ncbi:hypothetical protein KKF81_07125 [Candidatus Micrarchaeota archaeon]|nr:hypothetical protein [Candidatus Micrarchaeota archaeon]MBU1886127.1 hypothetical protein [Candidatus Micrarchaeota archaeon]
MGGSGGSCIVLLVAGFLGGLWYIYIGMKKYILLQKINNTPTSKVHSAAVGLIELYGKANCIDNISSPIAKQKCVYWKINAQYYKSGKHGGWRNFYTCNSTDQFYLKDDTGKIIVEPKEAQLEIPRDFLYQGYIAGKGFFGMSHKKMPQNVLDYIESLDEADKKRFMSYSTRDVRIYEWFIAEGDEVYILGNAEPRGDVQSTIGCENLIVRKGKEEKIMYICDTGEKKVVERFQLYKLEIFGGLAISAVSLLILLYMFSVGG